MRRPATPVLYRKVEAVRFSVLANIVSLSEKYWGSNGITTVLFIGSLSHVSPGKTTPLFDSR